MAPGPRLPSRCETLNRVFKSFFVHFPFSFFCFFFYCFFFQFFLFFFFFPFLSFFLSFFSSSFSIAFSFVVDAFLIGFEFSNWNGSKCNRIGWVCPLRHWMNDDRWIARFEGNSCLSISHFFFLSFFSICLLYRRSMATKWFGTGQTNGKWHLLVSCCADISFIRLQDRLSFHHA